MKTNERIVNILRQAKKFYFATVDENGPSVRPFNAVVEYDDKVYFYTNNHKSAFKQMKNNPMVELCAEINDERWIRIHGKAVFDSSTEAKIAMLSANPELRKMYSENDKIFEVFYLEDMSAVVHSIHSEREVIK